MYGPLCSFGPIPCRWVRVSFLSHSVKVTAEVVDRFKRPADGLVVLIYHRVGGLTGVPVDLPSDMFNSQIEMLAASDSVMSLDDAVDALNAGVDLAGRAVVTFDDGTADFVDLAVPILQNHGVPATLFVATKFVDEGIEFPDSGMPVTWAGLAEAVSTGLITIGSHTHSHVLLDRLEPDRVAEELDRSVDLIGEHLDVEARHFAYPKALEPSADADRAVRARFASASLAGTRANPRGTDVHRLMRSPIQVLDGQRWFARKVSGGLRLEDDLRAMVNRRRYRDAVA